MAIQQLFPEALWAEGVSSSVLQELLDNIDRQTEQVRMNLFHNLGGHVQQHPSQVSKDVLEAVAGLAALPAEPSAGATSTSSMPERYLGECARKFMEIQSHVDALQVELKAAQAAADLEATLREFQSYLENGQFNEAAWRMVQLRKISEASAASHPPGKAQPPDSDAAQLAAACTRCEAALAEALEATVHEAFDVELDGRLLTITTALPSGGDVGDLWAATELAGMEGAHLARIADVLLGGVLPPVLAGGARLAAHAAPGGESAIVQWQPTAAAAVPTSASAAAHVDAAVGELLQVLAAQLFRDRLTTIASFGRVFWPRFVELYQGCSAGTVAGASADVLRTRQQSAAQLERLAVQLGFAATAGDLSSALGRAVQASHHAAQQAYLARARDLLLLYDPHEPPVTVGQPLPLDAAFYDRYSRGLVAAWELLDPPSGWDAAGPLLATGFYQISHSAMQLAMHMDDVLSDACASGDTSFAQAAVATASKLALMFATMLPPADASDAPQLALLRHNDLSYLANHLLLLPYLYSPTLGQLVGSEVWYGDDAARMRAQARSVLQQTLALQQRALAEPTAALDHLRCSGGAADGARRAVRQLLHMLGRAGRLVWPVLAPGVALDFSARLLSPLYCQLVSDILAKSDIGVDECAEVVALCRPLVEDGVAALLSGVDAAAHYGLGGGAGGVAGGAGGSGGGNGGAGFDMKRLLADAVTHRTHGLRKLALLLSLMDAKLSDIVARWEGGELARGGLALGEVRRLVCAVFEDTDHRAQCLQRMEVAEVVA